MIQLPDKIKAIVIHPRLQKAALLTATLALLALAAAGIAWGEYRTNWVAQRLGALLLTTNSMRPQTGALWNQILAQSQTQQTINNADPLPTSQAGMPKPVVNNRFESTRVPETGPPSYVAIYKTPLPNSDLNTRPLGDVIASLRIYRQGLAIINALHLPNANFHAQIREQVENLYADLGDLQHLAPDTTDQLDTLAIGVLDPDSLKTAVFSELATELIPNLRQREKSALINDYKKGNITQIFLHRDLGRFQGELHHENGTIAFEINANTVSQIMNLPDSLDVSTFSQ